jgi:hypothetical protein
VDYIGAENLNQARSELMIAFLTEIAFWVLVIFLCVVASYALIKAMYWAGGRMAGILERAQHQDDQKRQD